MERNNRNVTEVLELIHQFNEAFDHQDIDRLMALMTEVCIFENTSPPPDGTCYKGMKAVRKAFEQFFRSSPHAEFITEEMFTAENRCIVRWIYYWRDENNQQGHVRGVDVFRIQDGKIAEKLSYVKG